MSGFWGHAMGAITVLLLVAFLAIWVWAWLPRHKKVFDRMARVPLDDDERPPSPSDQTRDASGRGADDPSAGGEGDDKR